MAEQNQSSTEAHSGEAHAVPKALGMDASMWVALAMLIVIIGAVWIKVPAMIGAMLDKKIAGIKEQLDAAENLRKEAEALKAEYTAKSKQAALDAEAMKAAAANEAKEIVAKAKTDAATMVARRTAMAEQKIAAAELAAIADIRTKAATTAAAAASILIAEKHDGKSDKGLIDATISALN
jgi:F-type H+-transporting ATPase subunit b